MGNMNAYRRSGQAIETVAKPLIPTNQDAETTSTTTSTTTATTVQPSIQESPVATPAPVVAKKRPPYVHPFIEMINHGYSESEMIDTLEAFCGRIEVGTDSAGRPLYEAVDQTEFIAPVLHVFSYCATNGKTAVVQWLFDNFVPLQVSYDNNFCYFDCLKWGHSQIADWIAEHESFYPSMEVLENLLSRGRYTQFHKCMSSPYLKDDLFKYRFTFMYYIDNARFSDTANLLQKIKQRIAGQTVEITDEVYPNPRLAQQQATQPEPEVVTTITPPASDPIPIPDSGLGIHHRNVEEEVIIDQ